jgi:hypothetical protein
VLNPITVSRFHGRGLNQAEYRQPWAGGATSAKTRGGHVFPGGGLTLDDEREGWGHILRQTWSLEQRRRGVK